MPARLPCWPFCNKLNQAQQCIIQGRVGCRASELKVGWWPRQDNRITVIKSQTARQSFLHLVNLPEAAYPTNSHHGWPKDFVGTYSLYFQSATEAQYCISMAL